MSFISAEPQSRVVLESYNNYLFAQFDTQLRIIADRYLAFFQERRSIEETYINSLRKLHRKAKTVDASFDPRAEPTTTRTAWDKVRDNLRRDADAQQAFIDILANDVIKPLETFKESGDKVIAWAKLDLEKSASFYAVHAENKVSMLQQAYLRKYQPQQYTYPANVSQRPQDIPSKVSGSWVPALFRGQWEDSDPSDEALEDECREAVADLNSHRLFRAESLRGGYNLLEYLVFTPTIRDVLVKYMGGMIKACAKHDDIAKSTRAEVENALGGTDTSDLKMFFRRAISFSTPPLTLYHNYRPGGYSNLIFGVPLVDLGMNEENVPKVMRMCIDEVEKRGLYIKSIYSGSIRDTEVRKLLRRFESEVSFSFTSADNIQSVANLLRRYLYDLPEPLFVLSLRQLEYRANHRDEYNENNLTLLRSKIHELHPVHRASLEALLRHLLHVSSHSDKNRMTVRDLSARLWKPVLGYYSSMENGIDVKTLVMEDLIRYADTLFDELPSRSPPPNVAEATSTDTYGSFLTPELLRSTDIQATGSTSRHRPGIFDGTHTPTQSSSLFPSDGAAVNRFTPPQTALMSPLRGLSLSTEGVQTTTQARGTQSNLRPLPHSEALRIPQSPPESISSSTSEFTHSSATSLQTTMWSP